MELHNSVPQCTYNGRNSVTTSANFDPQQLPADFGGKLDAFIFFPIETWHLAIGQQVTPPKKGVLFFAIYACTEI